jgi:hypothetical protein
MLPSVIGEPWGCFDAMVCARRATVGLRRSLRSKRLGSAHVAPVGVVLLALPFRILKRVEVAEVEPPRLAAPTAHDQECRVAFDVVREVRKLRGRLPLLVLPRKWGDHSAIVHRPGRGRQACLRPIRKPAGVSVSQDAHPSSSRSLILVTTIRFCRGRRDVKLLGRPLDGQLFGRRGDRA